MQLRIGENILTLRRERKIRQEELADFLGVIKASVSKWETRQSYPDILLLPQIAAFFNISIDELLGYEPQLSKEQIIKVYMDLTKAFAEKPFDEVMARTKELVKEYYSCYPFLLQVALLWTNHYMLTPEPEKQLEILNDIVSLCDHINQGSDDIALEQDAIVLKSMINVLLGKVTEVIELLQPLVDAKNYQLSPDSILIQAFQASGDLEKAEYYNQVMLYSNLMNTIANSIIYIGLHIQDTELCESTIERTQRLIELFEMEQLNPNIALQLYYQAAIFYCMSGQKERALDELTKFINFTIRFLREGIKFHGDKYFNHLDEWFEESPFGANPPRNEKVVYESLGQALEHPAFAILADSNEFQFLKKKVKKGEF